jgi:hypothetical protein
MWIPYGRIKTAAKIKPLYLTHNTYYLTSNTTRVVQQQQIIILVSRETFTKRTDEFTGASCSLWDSQYKICLYGNLFWDCMVMVKQILFSPLGSVYFSDIVKGLIWILTCTFLNIAEVQQ